MPVFSANIPRSFRTFSYPPPGQPPTRQLLGLSSDDIYAPTVKERITTPHFKPYSLVKVKSRRLARSFLFFAERTWSQWDMAGTRLRNVISQRLSALSHVAKRPVQNLPAQIFTEYSQVKTRLALGPVFASGHAVETANNDRIPLT